MIKIRRILTTFMALIFVSPLLGCVSTEPSPDAAVKKSFEPAMSLFASGNFNEAIPAFNQEIEAAQTRGVSKRHLAEYQLKIAECYFSVQKFEQALEEVKTAIKNSGLTYSIKLTPYLRLKSLILYKMKRFKESRKSARKLLALQEMKLGPDAPELIETLDLLISASCAEDKCIDTEPLLKKQLKIKEKHLGKDHEHVAASLAMLAELKEKKGDLDAAEKLYRKVLLIRKKSAPHLVEATEKNILRIELKRLKKKD